MQPGNTSISQGTPSRAVSLLRGLPALSLSAQRGTSRHSCGGACLEGPPAGRLLSIPAVPTRPPRPVRRSTGHNDYRHHSHLIEHVKRYVHRKLANWGDFPSESTDHTTPFPHNTPTNRQNKCNRQTRLPMKGKRGRPERLGGHQTNSYGTTPPVHAPVNGSGQGGERHSCRLGDHGRDGLSRPGY